MPLSTADAELRASLRRFVSRRLLHDLNVARSAGHGYGHLPHSEWPETFVRLDLTDNVRPSYDHAHIRRFDPRNVAHAIEQRTALLRYGDIATLMSLAQEWSEDPEFDPAWRRAPITSREATDILDSYAGYS